MTTLVAGVDGCRAGWIAVVHPVDAPTSAELHLFSSVHDILAFQPDLRTIAIDIPIGLPENGSIGGRSADREARAVLGQRQSAVFAVPSRAAVMCSDYRTACATALETSDPPRKVSKQTFNLFPKIREVDSVVTPKLQNRIFECHPEVAFWALNGNHALQSAKKIKSRPNPDGLAYRRKLLGDAGYPPQLLNADTFRTSQVGPDDILDACAAAWSANRICHDEAICFPAKREIDAKGLRMEIWG